MSKLVYFLPQDTSIRIADKEYQLSEMHLNAQAAIEQEYGLDLMGLSGVTGDLGKLIELVQTNIKALRFVLYQLMLRSMTDCGRKPPSFFEDELGYHLNPSMYPEILVKILMCITNSLPAADEKKKLLADQVKAIQAAMETIGISSSPSQQES